MDPDTFDVVLPWSIAVLTVPTLDGLVSDAVVTRLFVEPGKKWYSRRPTPDSHPSRLLKPYIQEPQIVKKGDPIIELSTGQIIVAPTDGNFYWCVPAGSTVKAGDKVGKIKPSRPLWSLLQSSPPTVVLGNDLDNGNAVTATMEQLCSGCYILGVQGMGKSSLLEEIARQLLDKDESVIIFDPHGQLIDDIVARMPARRLADTYHLNLKDREYPFGLNVFACADPDNEEERDRTRNQVTHAFEKLWPETRSGVYFKKLLRHVIILLIEHPHLTLADVPRILRDTGFRTQFTQSPSQ